MLYQVFKHSWRKLSPNLPLRTILIVPFVLQIFTTVGVVGYLSFKNGQAAVDNLANQLMDEVGERIQQNLASYLEVPHTVNRINLNAIRLGYLQMSDLEDWEKHLLLQVQEYPNITFVGVGNENNQYRSGEKLEDGTLRINVADDFTNYNFYSYNTDNEGKRTTIALMIEPYRLTERPEYQASIKAGKPSWTPVFVSFLEPTLLISGAEPVYDDNNQVQGIVISSLRLDRIGEFLNKLEISQSGQVFITDRQGTLLATSTSEKPFRSQNGERTLFKAQDSQDLLTQSVANFLVDEFDNLSQVSTYQQWRVRFEDERFYLKIVPFQDDKGLDWLITILVPESDFMGQIQANTRITIVLCSTALIVAIAIGILTARWVTKPLLRLNQAAKAIAKGEWNKTVSLHRRDELGQLAESFNWMANQLRELFETLEDKVQERTAELANANEQISKLNEKLKEENIRMSAEINVARQIQKMILPKSEELDIEGLDIAGFMQPADEVGGDYYDVLSANGVVTIGIGDVTGHGLESGLLMVMTQVAIRTLKEIHETNPVSFLDTLNQTIYKNVKRMNSDRNLTLAILNYAEGKLSISGQHEEVILVRSNGEIERIDTLDLGFPIGLDNNITAFIDQVSVTIEPGEGVVVYTDGITEAENVTRQYYGIERLCQVIRENWQTSAQEIQDAVINDVRDFIGQQKIFDDITLVVLKRLI
ncbi:MAG: SpoIIE family protein phosphatase [Chroococcales cyanobacterium]